MGKRNLGCVRPVQTQAALDAEMGDVLPVGGWEDTRQRQLLKSQRRLGEPEQNGML